MNNKGFSLIELLLSIAVLAIIVLIAVPSINGISDLIKNNQRKNIIENIEIASAKYAFDTGKTLIFVDELVTSGYIGSDDDGNVIDPVNSIRINCFVVEMEKVADYYNAVFVEDKNYDDNGICNLDKLQDENVLINVSVLNNGISVTDTNNWLKGTVYLKASSNSIEIDCEKNKCVWTSSSGKNITGSDEVKIENVNSLLETKYVFQMTVYDNESQQIKRYTSDYINLKIDNEEPTIYKNEIVVTDRFVYTESKNVTIEASDGNGSGIYGYYLGIKGNKTCYNEDLNYTSSKSFTINENGNYLICVKDNLGNISTYDGLNIKYINS